MSEYKVTELEREQRAVTTKAKQAYGTLLAAEREAEQLLDAIGKKQRAMKTLMKRLITTAIVVGAILALLLWIKSNI